MCQFSYILECTQIRSFLSSFHLRNYLSLHFSRLCTLHSKEGEQNRIIIRSVPCEMNHFSTIIIKNHQQCFHRHTSRHQQCLGLVTLLWKTSDALMDSLCWRFVHTGVYVCMCEVSKKGLVVSSVLLPGGVGGHLKNYWAFYVFSWSKMGVKTGLKCL